MIEILHWQLSDIDNWTNILNSSTAFRVTVCPHSLRTLNISYAEYPPNTTTAPGHQHLAVIHTGCWYCGHRGYWIGGGVGLFVLILLVVIVVAACFGGFA
uniref:Uncharacterized protein n=1 Tax=Bursaphelenchus xylophilus TaxID=6326 RepID=A0A1I7SKW7_BURXY